MKVFVVTINGEADTVFVDPVAAEAYADQREANGNTVGIQICNLVEDQHD